MSTSRTSGSLHEGAASSSFFGFLPSHRSCCLQAHHGSLRRPASMSSVIILGSACLPRGRHIVLSAVRLKPATNVSRARPSSPAAGSNPRGQTVSCCYDRLSSALFSQAPTSAGSKWLSFFQIPSRTTASLRATAVRAFFGPILRASFKPQLFKGDFDLTVVSRQLAAS